MDCYTDAINHFDTHEHEINRAWFRPREHRYGYLFKFITLPDQGQGLSKRLSPTEICGCPSQIKMSALVCEPYCSRYVAPTPELTQAIRAIEPLPCFMSSMPNEVAVLHLQYFAEAQRMADKALGLVVKRYPSAFCDGTYWEVVYADPVETRFACVG